MKNTINYYYNLNPDKINHIFSYYYFYVNNELYFFSVYDGDTKNIYDIYNFNQEMIRYDILVNEIINNRNDTIITIVNGIPYILTKIYININKSITLGEINSFYNIKLNYNRSLMRGNWVNLWCDRVDYLEYHHEQNYQKYPILNESFNYFVGLCENAISYLNNILLNIEPDDSDIGVIEHNKIRFSDTIYSLYDPMNIIIDHKARDVAEYIKFSFFNDNYGIFDELDLFFKYNYFSFYGISLIIARVIYPSFYFDLYDDIINNTINEEVIIKITSRINEYEEYLGDVINYFHKYYNIYDINWLKKEVNPH